MTRRDPRHPAASSPSGGFFFCVDATPAWALKKAPDGETAPRLVFDGDDA
ncbi:MAG: hypothetical protein ACOVSW_18140 [Candidatus Kapaibacteriota bacterium]